MNFLLTSVTYSQKIEPDENNNPIIENIAKKNGTLFLDIENLYFSDDGSFLCNCIIPQVGINETVLKFNTNNNKR